MAKKTLKLVDPTDRQVRSRRRGRLVSTACAFGKARCVSMTLPT